MPLAITQVDAFTDRPFAGNPAAVCLLPAPAEPAWMQAVAGEMNLSETAFLVARAGGGYDLRWFTPAAEVPLCGHATLASAHVLWEQGRLRPDQPAIFHTRSGELRAQRLAPPNAAANCVGWIELDFPAYAIEMCEPPAGLLEALAGMNAKPLAVNFTGRRLGSPPQAPSDYLVELESEAAVRELAPEHGRLKQLPLRAVIVTGRGSTPGCDFVSRFFAPGVGVVEDPVTGSAHCALVPYWAAKLGKSELTAYQASPRGGWLRLRTAGERVKIAGQAVTVWRGELID